MELLAAHSNDKNRITDVLIIYRLTSSAFVEVGVESPSWNNITRIMTIVCPNSVLQPVSVVTIIFRTLPHT